MPRLSRVVIPGCSHHVTQRGNNRQDVFFVDDDRRVYLRLLGEQALRFGVEIEGFCLMTNHVHLVAVPRRPDSLAKALGRTHWLYSRYVNRMHGRSGHLWQNRFFSCALDDTHWWTAMSYVELNPVRGGIVRAAWRYPWSSAAAHCREALAGDKETADVVSGLLASERWRRAVGKRDWKDALRTGLTDREIQSLRTSTLTGRPIGTDSFISKLETKLGRRLRPLSVGRQKGWRKKKQNKR